MRFRIRRNGDDLSMFKFFLFANISRKLAAIHIGHPDIRQDDLRGEPLKLTQRIGAGTGHSWLSAHIFEHQ